MKLDEISQAMLEIEADVRRAHRLAATGSVRIRQHAAMLEKAKGMGLGQSLRFR